MVSVINPPPNAQPQAHGSSSNQGAAAASSTQAGANSNQGAAAASSTQAGANSNQGAAAASSNQAGGNSNQAASDTSDAPAKRPRVTNRLGKGTEGTPIQVLTNRARAVVPNSLKVYQYDLDIFKPSGDAMSNDRATCMRVVSREVPIDTLVDPGAAWKVPGPAYDGGKQLYTAGKPLALNPSALDAGWRANPDEQHAFTLALHAGTPRELRVTLKPAARFEIDFSQHHGGSGFGVGAAALTERRQVLNVVMRHQFSSVYKMIKDAYYDERQSRAWAQIKTLQSGGSMIDLWLGYRSTVVESEDGPMIEIDLAATTMLKPLNMLEFVSHELKMRGSTPRLHGIGENATFGGVSLRKINKQLTSRTLKVSAAHNHGSRSYTVRGVHHTPGDQAMFEDETGRSLSVRQWFREKFPAVSLRLQHPDFVLALVGPKSQPDKVMIPLEICTLLPGQPAKDAMTTDVQAAMVAATAEEPGPRFDKIRAVAQEYADPTGNAEHDSRHRQRLDEAAPRTMESFEVTIQPELVETHARVLEPATVEYADKRTCRIFVDKGSWNLQGGERFCVPGKCRGWAMAIFERLEQRHAIGVFKENFKKIAMERGVDLGQGFVGDDPIFISPDKVRDEKVEEELATKVAELQRSTAKPIDLLVCVIGDKVGMNAKYLHPAIKRWSHTMSGGIPTQCVQVSKALTIGGPKNDGKWRIDQYHAGLWLKINLKLGGVNCIARSPGNASGLNLMEMCPTMVFGLDVNHSAPGSFKPSYGALVGSMDKWCTQYMSKVFELKFKQEVVNDKLYGAVTVLLRHWIEVNNVRLRRIIFYRDGVAHNQLQILESEVAQIRQACEVVLGHAVDLTFIVTQMRTHARFANLPPGSVMDGNITLNDSDDWYFVPHHALKGTARPSHYHVIEHDNGTAVDMNALQRFTYDLCFLYSRATKIVSRPAPVYWAHRAAFMGPFYCGGYREASGAFFNDAASVSSGHSGDSWGSWADVLPEVSKTLYYA